MASCVNYYLVIRQKSKRDANAAAAMSVLALVSKKRYKMVIPAVFIADAHRLQRAGAPIGPHPRSE